MGIGVLQKLTLEPDDARRYFHDQVSTFIEHFLNPEDTHGAQVVLGQFDA